VTSLPVEAQLSDIFDILDRGDDLLLSAPPGSGKSTVVPAALLGRQWCSGEIWVSQPRRLAATALASRVAELRGGKLGGEVGYSVRFDRAVSAQTKLRFVTAGLLLRRLQSDPFLEGISAVVLDEFHERSLDSDLSLALLRQIKNEARPDLRLVVMSATLDSAALLKALPKACLVRAEGRLHPVDIEHLGSEDRPLAQRAATAASRALSKHGKTLVFLPGVYEIERCQDALSGATVPVLPLHSRLPKSAQLRALSPKVESAIILATNIAETSLTIEGLRCVVDSGLVRRPVFDARLGLTRLTTIAISRASAEQRAGRAGRVAPGHCFRLWSAAEQMQRRAFDAPDIANADLSSAALQVLAWGQDPQKFPWFEKPPSGHLRQALKLLRELEAVDEEGALSTLGRQLAELPLEPRLARMMLSARELGLIQTGARLAALSSEGDILKRPPPPGIADDLSFRLAQLEEGSAVTDAGARRRVLQVAKQLERLMAKGKPRQGAKEDWQALLLPAFSDRLARRNDDGSYALAAGFRAVLDKRSRCPKADLILAFNLQASAQGLPRISAALPIEASSLKRSQSLELRFDPDRNAVVYERIEKLGSLVVSRVPAPSAADPGAVGVMLFENYRTQPQRALHWSKGAIALAQRLRFCRHHGAHELPDPDDQVGLLEQLCYGKRSLAELKQSDLKAALKSQMDFKQRSLLERWAPSRLMLPNGASAQVNYAEVEAPVVAAKVQAFFGLSETPRLAEGRVAARCHLLAPNGRPAQITQDLAGFWDGSYAEVRKALRGRYPKHAWPEDPRIRQSS
jgi:ATP-dependent helicase HrpB